MPKGLEFSYNEFTVPFQHTMLHFFVDDGFVNATEYASQKHHHEYNEIIFIKKGFAQISANGQTLQIPEGNMLLTPAGLEHSLRSFENTVFITISYWGEPFGKIPGVGRDVAVYSDPHISAAFNRIAEYYNEKHTYKQELMVLCFTEIMHLLKELSDRNESAQLNAGSLESNNYRNYIVERYFHARFNQSPNLSELSRLLNLSEVQTQRIIKKIYGMSFCEKVLLLRMEYAKTLLLKNELSVSEISFKVGYNTESNFFSTFKRYYGITPKQYRKSNTKA